MTPQRALDVVARYEAKCKPLAGKAERFTTSGVVPDRRRALAHVVWVLA